MVAASDADADDDRDAERRFRIDGVPWSAYVAFRDALDDENVHVSMTYLDGSLEFMSPSRRHEEEGKIIALLLEAWAQEKEIDLRGFGGTTFRNESAKRGAEPDECYSLGPLLDDAPPHLAIEVIVASPLLDKLDVYQGLGVAEVWVWRSKNKKLDVFCLDADGLKNQLRSRLLPDIDLELLASFVRAGESHIAIVKAYRAAVRA